jgi:hypothetical protein
MNDAVGQGNLPAEASGEAAGLLVVLDEGEQLLGAAVGEGGDSQG